VWPYINTVRVFLVPASPCVLQQIYDNALVLLLRVSCGLAQFRTHCVRSNFLLTYDSENAVPLPKDSVHPDGDHHFPYSIHTCNCNQSEVLSLNLCVLPDIPTEIFRDFSQSLQENTSTLRGHVSRVRSKFLYSQYQSSYSQLIRRCTTSVVFLTF
jgi:hypothetical protein